MNISLDLEALRTAVALLNLDGALDPTNGATMGEAAFETYAPVEGGPEQVYLRIPVTVSQSDDPIYALLPLSVVKLAAGRLPIDILFGDRVGDKIAAVAVVGDSVDALSIQVTLPADIIDRIAAQN